MHFLYCKPNQEEDKITKLLEGHHVSVLQCKALKKHQKNGALPQFLNPAVSAELANISKAKAGEYDCLIMQEYADPVAHHTLLCHMRGVGLMTTQNLPIVFIVKNQNTVNWYTETEKKLRVYAMTSNNLYSTDLHVAVLNARKMVGF
ncbi:hypothetical protein CL653_00305 [bacterium]|nr:hypothetical protein [bacterium]|tara:strand:+ start:245 stop:685 length:441 start_codon:yes stop_codon:yes gene_type:complete